MEVRGIGQPDDSPVSKSAMLLSTACAVVTKDPAYARTYRDPFAERFAVAISEQAADVLSGLDDAEARRAFIAGWEEGMPGLITHVVYRKPLIEEQVRAALDAGLRQMVIFGAGADTLSLRLSDVLGATPVFEVDRPEVIAFRREVLAGGIETPPGLTMVAVDFEHQRLEDPLRQAGFDPSVPTVFVAEGVMEYLSLGDVDAIFDFVRRGAPVGSRFVFTFLARSVYDDDEFEKLKGELKEGGETLRFGIVPERLDAFLEARGMGRVAFRTPDWIRDHYVPKVAAPVDIIPGFHFVAAETTG